MKIGIFSDVHDNKENLRKAREVFEKNQVETVLFCGDLISPLMFQFLTDWPFKIKAVLGNNEGDIDGIKRRFKKYDLSHIEYPKKMKVFELKIDGLKTVIYHGNNYPVTTALVNSNKYDLVCTGHTHEPHIKKINNTIWINPGSVVGFSESPKVKIGSVAIFDTKSKKGKIVELR